MKAFKVISIIISMLFFGAVNSNAQCSFTLTQGNLCSGGTSVVLTASGGGTNYQWFANGQPLSGSDYVIQGNQLTIYNPSGKFGLDFYSLVTSANCIPGVPTYQTSTNNLRLSYNGTAPGAAASISGNTTPCIGQTFSYSVPTIANATDYVWTAPLGASITWISSDKKTISIYYAIGSSNGNVIVTGSNACGSSQSSFPINITNVYAITGEGGLCPNTNPGTLIGLNGSQSGVTYQLYYQPDVNSSYNAQGSPVAGTGGSISFGRYYAPGNYAAKATSPSGCVLDMSGILTVYFYDVPNGYTVTGGGDYCIGSSGISVGLNGSQSGVTYELYKDGTYVGPSISGTGSALGFGSQTVVGSYSVQAVNSGGCKLTTNSVTITASSPVTPSVNISANKTTICTGENVTFTATPTNGGSPSYQWMLNGSPVSGAQSSSYSTTGLANGQQVSVVMYTSMTCVTQSSVASNTIGITVNTAPIITTPPPASLGPCDGSSTSIFVGSSNATGYQWYWSVSNGPAPQSSPWSGTTTNTLSINPVYEGINGNYWAVLTNSCGSTTSNISTVTVKPYPRSGGITGTPSVCLGATGITYDASSIQEASSYAWNIPIGAHISSSTTSSVITVDFPSGSISGSVTATGHNSCGDGPTASYGVTVNVPVTPSVSISANKTSICPGENVTFTATPTNGGSTPAYQWMLNGSPIIGAQSSSYSTTGIATGQQVSVVMTTSLTCVTQSVVTSNSIGAIVNPLPTLFPVTGGGSYCYNQAGPEIRLGASETGVNYQLLYSGSSISTLSGTGGVLNFGAQTGPGSYTIVGTNATTGCAVTMTGSATVIGLTPVTTLPITGSGTYCSGTNVTIGMNASESGVNYQLFNGASAVGSSIAGSSAINFPSVSAAGNYTVKGTSSNGCQALMTGSVIINPSPSLFNVTGGGSYCEGSSIGSIGLDNSQSDATYQLYKNGSVLGSPLTGTGASLDFGVQAFSGDYTVKATHSLGCTAVMNRTATVVINPKPTAGTITGWTEVCAGMSMTALYRMDGVSNALSYKWTLPPGLTIHPGEYTNQILVDVSSSAEGGNKTVSVRGTNNCGDGPEASMGVLVSYPIVGPSEIKGSKEVYLIPAGVAHSEDYFVDAVPNTNYNWTLPANTDASIIAGANTNHITILFPSQVSNFVLTVSGSGSAGGVCGGWGLSMTINAPPVAPTATANQTFCGGLTMASINATAPYYCSITWYPSLTGGGAISNNAPLLSGTYYAASYNPYTNLESASRTEVNIILQPPLVLNPGGGSIVPGGSITLGGSPTASGGSGSGYTYAWSPSLGLSGIAIANPMATPSSTTTYTLSVTDSNGCGASATASVTVSSVLAYTSTSLRNSVESINYDANGNVTGQSIAYSDLLGRGVQSQSRNLTQGNVMVSQTIYDALGRAAINTLAAPVAKQNMDYVTDYVTNPAGQEFDYTNFNKVDAMDQPIDPDAVSGQLANYYSTSNTLEPYTPTSAFPYTQVEYSKLNPGAARKSAAAGENHRLGSGHETQTYTMAVPESELGNFATYFSSLVDVKLETQGMTKTIGIDADGNVSIVYTSTSGKQISACYADPDVDALEVTANITTEKGYCDIHLNQGDNVNISDGSCKVYNLADDTELGEFSGTFGLNPGVYRFEYIGVPADGTFISYHTYYKGYSFNFYDNTGRSVFSLSPKGFVDWQAESSKSFETMKVYASYNQYNSLGWLLSSSSPDEGLTNYRYATDGRIRFSQNAQQRPTLTRTVEKFSYTNYDDANRPTESGECTASFADANLTGKIKDNISQWARTFYDFPADGKSYRGSAQNYTIGKVVKTSTCNDSTYYSYTYDGKVEWIIQDIKGLGEKTIEYVYDDDIVGRTSYVIYQRDKADEFTHHYTYDLDGRLNNVYTKKYGDATEMLQAHYVYYAHGPLKRVELASNLQGIDYVYNINGWLKSINHPDLTANDPGGDGYAGNAHSSFKPDVFAMGLDYYSGDYVSRTGQNITSMPGTPTYNGNITASRWGTRTDNTAGTQKGAYQYTYSNRGFLDQAIFGTITGNNFNITNAFSEVVTGYDENGNITGLRRLANSNFIDRLTYHYTDGFPNRLNYVSDFQGASVTGTDIAEQADSNYGYNDIGQMTKNVQDKQYFTYDVYGHVTEIFSDEAHTESGIFARYTYNDKGFRSKKVAGGKTTWYVRDASGGILATYEGTTPKLSEINLYGASRIGLAQANETTGTIEKYVYELTDNIGNVRATISATTSGGFDVVSYADYYPFGMEMPGRNKKASDSYKYGYQGQYAEKDESGYNHFELRDYDSRIGRWLVSDPMKQHWSPYLAMSNNPLKMTDQNGGEDGYGGLDGCGGFDVFGYLWAQFFSDCGMSHTPTPTECQEIYDKTVKVTAVATAAIPLLPLLPEAAAGSYSLSWLTPWVTSTAASTSDVILYGSVVASDAIKTYPYLAGGISFVIKSTLEINDPTVPGMTGNKVADMTTKVIGLVARIYKTYQTNDKIVTSKSVTNKNYDCNVPLPPSVMNKYFK